MTALPYDVRPESRRIERAATWVAAAGRGMATAAERLARRRAGAEPPVCEPDRSPVVFTGTVHPGDEHRYLLLPVAVRPGTARLDVSYSWTERPPAPPPGPLTATTLDLGLWDEHGYRSADGFRGWSGDRQRHVFVEAAAAERGYRPGRIGAGVWHVELGIGAVGPTGADWRVEVRAARAHGRVAGQDAAPPPDPVDPGHVARPEPGWYHADFHVHGWHSHPQGPPPAELVAAGRAAGLDVLAVTEYVVGHHWDTFGAVQRANPDLVVWPGREIVTYAGHVQSLGETPGFVEFRHGFEDVTIGGIQAAVRAAGALFGVNHPTTFPGPLFRNACRGCAFELGDAIDWHAVDTIEILTGAALVDPRRFEFPSVGVPLVNPFFRTAVDLWESLLNRGYRVTAVCGSDAKLPNELGGCATALFCDELSRPAVIDAIRAGRAYVRARGVVASPALELVAEVAGQPPGTFGSTFALTDPEDRAELRITVSGGDGQVLRLVRNGRDAGAVIVAGDPFEHTFSVARAPEEEGPLGTWYRVETVDGRGPTAIANPVFLQAAADEATSAPPAARG